MGHRAGESGGSRKRRGWTCRETNSDRGAESPDDSALMLLLRPENQSRGRGGPSGLSLPKAWLPWTRASLFSFSRASGSPALCPGSSFLIPHVRACHKPSTLCGSLIEVPFLESKSQSNRLPLGIWKREFQSPGSLVGICLAKLRAEPRPQSGRAGLECPRLLLLESGLKSSPVNFQ